MTASVTATRPGLVRQTVEFSGDIKLSHSIFALPFALLAAFMAEGGWPHWGKVALIVLCMVFARTYGMGMNRLVDARLDAVNPRTRKRALPDGRMTPKFARTMTTLCGVAFVLTTAGFLAYGNWIPLAFSLPVLAFVGLYPSQKRYNRFCHYYLGAALALAPICSWVAVAGSLTIEPFIMAAAVICWTAGFDIIYACQDIDTDRMTGVQSLPAAHGAAKALFLARATHIVCVALLAILGIVSQQLGLVWFTAVAIVLVLLIIEHGLVSPTDLSKVNISFFTINGIISICLGVLGVADVLILKW